MAEVKDFTPVVDPVRFKIHDDVFEGVEELPTGKGLHFIALMEKMDPASVEDHAKVIEEMVRLVLVPESAQLMLDRLDGKGKAIGLKTFTDVLQWLMEKYGLRPTELSSDSSPGQNTPESGMNSTENGLVPVSISQESLFTHT